MTTWEAGSSTAEKLRWELDGGDRRCVVDGGHLYM